MPRKKNRIENEAENGSPFSDFIPIEWDSTSGRIVGSKIQHYWIMDKKWFSGRIVRFNSKTGEHLVKYDIDEEELWLKISRESIFICSKVSLHQVCSKRLLSLLIIGGRSFGHSRNSWHYGRALRGNGLLPQLGLADLRFRNNSQ